MKPEERIADLTVEQLTLLIRRTVQEARSEVLLEFSLAAKHDADLCYEAEMTDLLRSAMQDRLVGRFPVLDGAPPFDD